MKQWYFLVSFLYDVSFISVLLLIALAKIKRTMLNNNDDGRMRSEVFKDLCERSFEVH